MLNRADAIDVRTSDSIVVTLQMVTVSLAIGAGVRAVRLGSRNMAMGR